MTFPGTYLISVTEEMDPRLAKAKCLAGENKTEKNHPLYGTIFTPFPTRASYKLVVDSCQLGTAAATATHKKAGIKNVSSG